VIGNLIFADVPMSGPMQHALGNLGNTVAHAGEYVTAPSFDASTMDFYPLPAKCESLPLDLKAFAAETDYELDFNGTAKDKSNQGMVFRGAYAGAGKNPGWKLQLSEKNAVNQAQAPSAIEITPSGGKRGESGSFLIVLHTPKQSSIAGVQWELRAGAGITIDPSDIVIGSAAAGAEKTLACSAMPPVPGQPLAKKCLLAGGKKNIPDGPIAIVRYRVGRQADGKTSAVRLENILGVDADLKMVDLGHAAETLAIQ
jgi:hypothetical protein